LIYVKRRGVVPLFEVNLAGVALVLDLLDEIEELRAAMRRIPGALST
jgi:hypothetical protein